MMLGRQRASVEERSVAGGRVDEGNERGRGEAWRKRAKEGLNEEWRGSKGAREGNFKGGILSSALVNIQYSHEPSQTRPLPLILCYYK